MAIAHEWDVTVTEATAIQKALREKVSLMPLGKRVESIAGADLSFNRFSTDFHAAIVVFSFPDLEPIDRALVRMEVTFPYVPGYLSFREVPPLVEAYAQLRHKPDVIMADGQGIAHPRRLGVAAHLGLALNTAVFGCAKSKLYGTYEEPGDAPGSASALTDPKTGELIGRVIRTKARTKPIFVSAGHKITLDESTALALATTRGYRIPEPTRRAHDIVNAYRRGEIG